jgi:hypothetical protein
LAGDPDSLVLDPSQAERKPRQESGRRVRFFRAGRSAGEVLQERRDLRQVCSPADGQVGNVDPPAPAERRPDGARADFFGRGAGAEFLMRASAGTKLFDRQRIRLGLR